MMSLLQQLQVLETEFHHPGVRCSRERLEALLHPEFHEVGRSGNAYGRETIIDYRCAQDSPPNVVSDAFTVIELAADVALVEFRSVLVESGGTLSQHTLRSSIWTKTAVGWQLRYHQGTPASRTW